MRGQKDLRSMKKKVNWIENQDENLYKILKNLNNTFWWNITPSISISGSKCDRDKPFFSAERGCQSDRDEV